MGQRVAEDIRAKGGLAGYCYGDVGQSHDLEILINYAVERYGRLDIRMNNAYSGQGAAVTDMDEADWDAGSESAETLVAANRAQGATSRRVRLEACGRLATGWLGDWCRWRRAPWPAATGRWWQMD